MKASTQVLGARSDVAQMIIVRELVGLLNVRCSSTEAIKHILDVIT
jgi:hypothetical protein